MQRRPQLARNAALPSPWRAILASLGLLTLAPLAAAQATKILPLSGMGEKDEAPVYWDFKLDNGRGGGQWQKIVVPSQWEQQGFGSYYYGTQGRGKPDGDPIIPKETGTYRRSFEIPADWKRREIHLVFEAAMTDTTVTINGRPAGPTHQGGFYRFSYDITRLVHVGTNRIEVSVAKESTNTSVNRAERRGDYWTFGGIYRPVWLEGRERLHIDWTAIDARADGDFRAQIYFNQAPPGKATVVARVYDAQRNALVGNFLATVRGNRIEIAGRVAHPSPWNAESPTLYRAEFSLQSKGRELDRLTQRFGFRTIEVRPNDGIYLNGRKVVLKGVNRHTFRPATGRTLTREENYADAHLIKSANMNAVRMSHYPPDPAFLDAADELGLYVLDELAGWQGSYDTPTGARLIGQIVRRDVNHPSILFWDNGNEGGWNTDNDGEFARWDPQQRKVLHPWAIHDDINTDHYEDYESTVKLSAGPQIFMPTEFLHGLYDGGIGAGFKDYWDVMGTSPTVAGGFFWAFADEGIERTDQDRRVDTMGNAAPDGIVGPHHEKEGSFFAVKEIWSPVQVTELNLTHHGLRMHLRNAYDFTNLRECEFTWRQVQLPAPGVNEPARDLARGSVIGPDLAARQSLDWEFPGAIPTLDPGQVLELSVRRRDATTMANTDLWTWTLRGPRAAPEPRRVPGRPKVQGLQVKAGDWLLEFDRSDGSLKRLTASGQHMALKGPWASAWVREQRGFRSVTKAGTLTRLELAPRGDAYALARANYSGGTLRSVTWRLVDGDLRVGWELQHSGEVDIYGIRFDAPAAVATKRWVGAGPYRIWKNRQGGTTFGLHEVAFNDPVPGESFSYPEFPGFFGEWDWLELRTLGSRVVFRNESNLPYFGLHRPQPGKLPVIDVPDLGWSFLHVIPPIGTKFTLAGVLGPQSRATPVNGPFRGEISLRVLPGN